MNRTELSERMQSLAEAIGNLPSTGMIESTRALAITGEALAVLKAVFDETDRVIAKATEHLFQGNGKNQQDMKTIRPC